MEALCFGAMMHVVPRETQRFLTRYGGKNPFGKPKWRLIAASDRMVKESGVYRDWAEGLSTAEKGGLRFGVSSTNFRLDMNRDVIPDMDMARYDNRPIRVVTEMREVRKYPQAEGWVLEKWFPASSYGTQAEWYSYKAIDGFTPMLGPYPECGDYEFMFGPWLHVPSVDVLEEKIRKHTNTIASRQGSPEQRAQEYMQRYQEQEELAEKKRKLEYEAEMRDKLSPMSSSSLASSRWRNDMAAKIGIREHVGIL